MAGSISISMRSIVSIRPEQPRLPLADLTVAVAAQHSGLDVLHYDHHFERLGDMLGVRALWITEPSA